jgi:molybdopterin synthase sulfur carrier subunit
LTVLLPSPLDSYTGGLRRARFDDAATVAEVLRGMERRWPGIRFRIVDEHDRVRPHMRIFVNAERCDDLARPVTPADEIMLVAALSGG